MPPASKENKKGQQEVPPLTAAQQLLKERRFKLSRSVPPHYRSFFSVVANLFTVEPATGAGKLNSRTCDTHESNVSPQASTD
jgi:hypothetical protein